MEEKVITEQITKSLLNFELSEKERQEIELYTQDNNIFFSLYFINKYFKKQIGKSIDSKSFLNLDSKAINFISNSLVHSYIKHLKESLALSLAFEYNLLKESGKDFNEFIRTQTNDREWIEYYLSKYAVINDLVDKTIKNATEFILKFLKHLNKDYPVLTNKFNIEINALKGIDAFMGDMHNGMQTVIKLTFKKKKIFYKPHNLNNELFVYSFMNFLEKLGLKKSMICPRTISFINRGWMEGVDYGEVNNEIEVNEFYLNQGINLAIFYFIGATDLIADNIIASGKYPCYYDLECILQPFIEGPGKKWSTSVSASRKFILTSVLTTRLLPQYSFETKDFHGVSISGLSYFEGETPIYQLKFVDGCFERLREKSKLSLLNSHLPMYENQIQKDSRNKVANVVKGFKIGYAFVIKHKDKISTYIKQNGKVIKARYLYRPSHVYAKLLNESFGSIIKSVDLKMKAFRIYSRSLCLKEASKSGAENRVLSSNQKLHLFQALNICVIQLLQF